MRARLWRRPLDAAPGMCRASGMRRSTLLELSGMELHEVAHVRRCFAGELPQGVRHAVVTPCLVNSAMAERWLTTCSGYLACRGPALHAGSGTSRYRMGLPSAS